jgi:hypothetical protein
MPIDRFPQNRRDVLKHVQGSEFVHYFDRPPRWQFQMPAENILVGPFKDDAGHDQERGPFRAVMAPTMSRFTLSLVTATPDGIFANIPPGFQLEIRAGSEAISEPVFIGTFQTQSFAEHGLLVQITGIQATQWEIWARAVEGAGASPARLYRVSMVVLLDEGPGSFSILTGSSFSP